MNLRRHLLLFPSVYKVLRVSWSSGSQRI